jgi:hypothetical protein
MVGHDDGFVECDIGAHGFGAPPFPLGNHTDRGQTHRTIDDPAEEWALVFGANRNEICAGGGAIAILQPAGFGAVSALEPSFGFS